MMPKVGQFCWNELATNNVKGSKDFYSKVFGWKFTEHDIGNGDKYVMVKTDDQEFGGFWSIPKEMQKDIPSHWMSYILVENVEDSLQKAIKNKATVIKPVTRAGDMGIFAIIKDPTGAHVALWQTLKMG